jgi:hypothetical protein
LIRYTARGAVALERLEEDAHWDSCTRSQNRGLTARLALHSRLWNCWRSSRPTRRRLPRLVLAKPRSIGSPKRLSQ